ncbi:glycosyltransferase family 39 protein [Lacinutrix sp. Hel_I_90]|uniref:ArnT family glycosyltransferase n=1 Tax=Lacinutrix sp. Hel_I_90 TaxID=1249999 RepID=UPI0005C8466E|nr:glycosyltransferase family 39 protein [Lacinutrix sp. Hel_I_90]
MIRFFKKHQDQLGLLLLWLLVIVIINPIGDFPLNDDWCYGKSVKTLLEEGYLKLYNWGEMTLVSHVYWGYFFTKLFGFSFTVLRWSTLLMGFATILGIYELFKLARVTRWMNLFGTVLCMMNPIFLSLSFSFMTDVPFYCMTVWCFYFYAKAINTENLQSIFWAVFFCCWAFLIRQLAWVFPVVWLITVLLTEKRTFKNMAKAILPLFALIIFAMLFSYFMESNDLLQERYNSKFNLLLENIRNIDKKLIILILSYFFRCLAYIGFLLTPILIFYIGRYTFKGYKIWAVLWTVLITGILIKIGKVLPSLDNIWIDFGVGPTTLYDHAGNFTTSPAPRAPELFWQIVTAIGVFSSVALLFHIRVMVVSVFNKTVVSPIVLLSFVFFTVYLTPFLLVGVYDRYLLPLFPIAIVFLAANSNKIPKQRYQYVAFAFLGALTWFSVCATHDYLSWNRVRWDALNELMASGISENHINGGVEFVTTYHFSEEQEKWWENVTPIYSLVFKPNKVDQVIKAYEYSRWLPGKGEMYLMFNEGLAKKVVK